MRIQGPRETFQILWMHTDGPPTGTVNIRDEKKRHCKSDRQNQKEIVASSMSNKTDQQITKNGDRGQKDPSGTRDAIPLGSLRVSLRVQYIVHP
jgi:hypothetical protein